MKCETWYVAVYCMYESRAFPVAPRAFKTPVSASSSAQEALPRTPREVLASRLTGRWRELFACIKRGTKCPGALQLRIKPTRKLATRPARKCNTFQASLIANSYVRLMVVERSSARIPIPSLMLRGGRCPTPTGPRSTSV